MLAVMETEEEHKSEIQDLDEFNDINIDQRALETFVPGRYLKATCAEKEPKLRSHVAELLDPLHMPLRVKQLVSNDDMSRQSRECYLHMWRTLIDLIFSVEKASVSEMMNLDKCKCFFENFNWPTDPLMSFADTETVFFNSHEIISAAANFVSNLEDVLADDWVLGTISDIYEKFLKAHLYLFNSYAENRPRAQTILENKGGISIFNGIIKEELQEVKTPFTDLLDAPLIMRSRLYYSLKILYSFTMENHPDYCSLKELLEVLGNIPGISRTSNGDNVFPLPIKSGYVVQQVKNIRKLRYLFFFPNYLIVTSLKFSCGTLQYKVRNIIHLGTNTNNSTTDVCIGDMKDKNIQQIRKILNHTKDKLRTYFMCPRESRGQLFKWKVNRLLKKVFKYEYFISLLMPHLRLIVNDIDTKKEYHFIFTSYFQQELWRQKLNENNYPDIDIEEFLTCIRQYSQVSQMPDLKFAVDDIHYYSGTLDVLVHQVHCLEENADSYITLQADSFGGYFNKIHKTDVVLYSQSPVYNESFEISLCCSENMKVALYTRPTTSADADFTLTLVGVLNFHNTSICNAYQFLLVPMYPSVKRTAAALSVRYTSDMNGNKRRMSLLQWEALDYIMSMRGAVFGKSLEDISEREKRDVPLILESCVKFIEERGLDVENIYLIPGNESHVEELMGVFDLCSFTGALSIKDRKYSVHDITNLLMNFLLSLPHPLLDNSKFYVSSDDIKTTERQAKVIQMLLRGLPEPNQSIFDFLIAHIVKVCQNRSKNKQEIERAFEEFLSLTAQQIKFLLIK